jgi:hypothetical protein
VGDALGPENKGFLPPVAGNGSGMGILLGVNHNDNKKRCQNSAEYEKSDRGRGMRQHHGLGNESIDAS